MSKFLIQNYLAELAKLRQVSGSQRESVVREAFKDLLKAWGRAQDLIFVPEYEIESPAKERRYVDGALLYGLRLPFGYWEAKDARDDLDAEIEFKFARGYADGQRVDNITDWALKQFRDHYKSEPPSPHPSPASGRGGKSARAEGKARAIGKQDIFHYVYAVLHDPVYRGKYALNLKREFPRIPFYADFWRWAQWGRELMDLHIGYEQVEPWELQRLDTPDEKARKNGAAPKAMLRADKDNCRIALDSETVLTGIPREAWDYKLGNRSALEWILDQYKEKNPRTRPSAKNSTPTNLPITRTRSSTCSRA